MSSLFPKPPKPQTPSASPPPPERNDEETAALAAEQRKATGKGRAFTMLTGGTGTGLGSSASRYLGGAART